MAYAFNDDKSKYDLEETIDNVDNLIGNMAAIEASPVIANHSIGEYIMYNGTLLKVLSPIATGENLVLGTNVTPINFGDEIKLLQDSVAHSGWKTLAANCYYCKIGQVVYIRIHGVKVSQGNTTLGTLPSGYRPSYGFDALPVSLVWLDGYHAVYLAVASNGTVYAHNEDSIQRALWTIVAIPL